MAHVAGFLFLRKMSGDLREIADDRAGRRVAARAASVIEGVADHVAAHQDGVEDAADRGEDVGLWNQRWMDAHLDRAVAVRLDDGEELEAVAELAGVENVLRCV